MSARDLLTILAGLLSGVAYSAPPTASHIFPAGGQRGTKVAVTCTGNFSSWPVQANAPGLEVTVAQESGKLEVSIPADFAADRTWIRLFNAEGTATTLPFLIGGLKELEEQEPNDSPRAAQAIGESRVTMNGVLKSRDVDGFAVRLDAGQTLVASVDAHVRLGSPMDAVLQIASTAGVVWTENHDEVQLDPRLAFTAPKSDTYVVRLFAFPSTPDSNIGFSGGPNYMYRLTLTTGPFITHAIPLTVAGANPGLVEVRGWNIPSVTKLPVVPFGGGKLGGQVELEAGDEVPAPPDDRWGLVFAPDFAGAARVRLTTLETQPTVATAANEPWRLSPNSTVTGWLKAPRQTDTYLLPFQKGESVVITAESSTHDFPLDPVLQLFDPKGESVATDDDTGKNPDVRIAHNPSQDGDYRLTVTDRFRLGGERFCYRLTVQADEPDFELTASADSLIVARDKPTEFAVKIKRRKSPAGSVGAIVVQAVGLPPGVVAEPVTSEPTGPTAESVTLKFNATGPAFTGPIQISGKADQPKPRERFVRTAARLGASFEALWLTVIEPK